MHELPARMTQLQAQIRAGEVTAAQAVAAQCAKAQRVQSQFACVAEEVSVPALAEGPLHGIVLSHKDIFNLPGRMPGCGVGTGQAESNTQAADVIDRLQHAGASQWASLVMAPFACGATSQNADFPRSANPLDEHAVVGGSSSGSAVAVAAGMSYVALGTDTAGSVRIPAATCGLLGLKTTAGWVSSEGCFPLAPSLDTVGLLARYAQDAREVFQVIAPQLTHEGSDQHTRSTSDMRCQVWWPDNLHAELKEAIAQWLKQVEVIGHIDLTDDVEKLSRYAQCVLMFETAQTHRERLMSASAPSGVQALGMTGLGVPQSWYQQAISMRPALLKKFVDRYFQSSSFIVLPAFTQPVPDWCEVEPGNEQFDREQLFSLHRWMGFVNYLGLPAITLPVARDSRGRPVQVQVLARPFSEHHLLDFAQRAESIFWIH